MRSSLKAFTIIELLIVITMIAILASLTIVAYSGIVSRSSVASVQSDLTNNAKKNQALSSPIRFISYCT